ncbi:MAG: hypothetical protein Q9179_005482 [Wetmoreana sp. 5 TL-2023]
MARGRRNLPQQGNPEIQSDVAPDYQKLVSDRRLGQTNLAVKTGHEGTSNATKKENLGLFDYAHLKRRSTDGYVSASGMFKAAYPWAKISEEKAEKEYIKSFGTTSREEVAGNIWVSPSNALELAKDYNMTTWIAALLDPAPIPKGSENVSKSISPPPKYVFTANDQTLLPPPASRASTPARPRGRPRNGSPAKSDKAMSPRKQRASKATKAENAANAKAAAAVLQDALNEDTNAAGDKAQANKVVKLEVNETTQVNGDIETTTTNVKFDLPGGVAAEIPPQEAIEETMRGAKAMVEEARKLEGESSKTSQKRKADELDESDEEADSELQPAKRARLVEQELKKEKVKNRALFGVAATLAIGTHTSGSLAHCPCRPPPNAYLELRVEPGERSLG